MAKDIKDKKLLGRGNRTFSGGQRILPLSIQNIGVPVTFGNSNLIRFVPPSILKATVGKGKPIPSGGVTRVNQEAISPGRGNVKRNPKTTRELPTIKTKKELMRVYRSQQKTQAKDQLAGKEYYGYGQPAPRTGKKLPLPKKRGGPVGYSQRWKTGRKG